MRLDPSGYRSLAAYGTLGLEFVFSVVLGLFGGRWLDEKFGTNNVMTLRGLLLGVIIVYLAIWRVAKRAERAPERDAARPGRPPDPPPGFGPS